MPKLVIRQGQARMVYSDRFAPIARAIGQLSITRATDVEFNPARQEWEATHRATGAIIAYGQNRAAVIAQEVEYLEREEIC